MENVEIKYKLTMIERWKSESGATEEQELTVIGTFADEQSLARWATRNDGELAKEELAELAKPINGGD